MEIAAQRASEEADRFRLPSALAARVATRELDGQPAEDTGAARKRKRLDDGASRGLHAHSSAALILSLAQILLSVARRCRYVLSSFGYAPMRSHTGADPVLALWTG